MGQINLFDYLLEEGKKVEENKEILHEEKMLKHKKLVYKICRQYQRVAREKFLELDDLVQVGMFGLHKAIENFDESLNYQFSTFAYFYIRGHILTELNKYERGARYTKKTMQLRDRIVREQFQVKSAAQIAKHYEVDYKLAYETFNAVINLRTLDLDHPQELDEGVVETMGSYVQSNDKVEDNVKSSWILELLTEEEEKMILLKSEGYTQNEISEVMGITQSSISRMLKRIQDKIRNHQDTRMDYSI